MAADDDAGAGAVDEAPGEVALDEAAADEVGWMRTRILPSSEGEASKEISTFPSSPASNSSFFGRTVLEGFSKSLCAFQVPGMIEFRSKSKEAAPDVGDVGIADGEKEGIELGIDRRLGRAHRRTCFLSVQLC